MNKESEIIKAIVAGEKEAFSILYKQFSEKIYNTALSYTKNVEEAEEITQDVFIKVFKNIRSFEGSSSLNTWIYRITTNTSLNYVKKANRLINYKNSLSYSTTRDFDHPGVLLENKENVSALYKVMDGLPENQKTAFILSFIEYLPRQEVADIMELSLKAVESLLQRAKKNMRKELEKIYPNRRKSKK